jgi:hypothetical protein
VRITRLDLMRHIEESPAHAIQRHSLIEMVLPQQRAYR